MVPALIHNREQTDRLLGDYLKRLQPFYTAINSTEKAPLWMACLAAFPVAVNIELLYQLWANFKQLKDRNGKLHVLPVLAVNDCILSSLWRETNNGIFEMNADTRAILLNTLRENFDETLLNDLASFLYKYVQHKKGTGALKNFYDAQEWTAILAVNPKQAAADILGSLATSLNNTTGLFQSIGVSNLIATMVKENPGFAEIMHQALDEQPAVPATAITAQNNAQQKTLVIRPGSSSSGIQIDLPEEVSSRLMPLYKSKQVTGFPLDKQMPEQGTVYSILIADGSFGIVDESAAKTALNIEASDTFASFLTNKKMVAPQNQVKLYNQDASLPNITDTLQRVCSSALEEDTIIIYVCYYIDPSTGIGNNPSLQYNEALSTGIFPQENTISPAGIHTIINEFAKNNPGIVTIFESGYTEAVSQAAIINPKHIVITGGFGGWDVSTHVRLANQLITVFSNNRQNLTYKNLYAQLSSNNSNQHPVMIANKDAWDYYFLTNKKEPAIIEEQRLLSALGYNLFIDGEDSAAFQQARAGFEQKYHLKTGGIITFELRKAVQLKDKTQLSVLYIRVSENPDREPEFLTAPIDKIKNTWVDYRGILTISAISHFDLSATDNSLADVLKEIMERDILLIGINNYWVNNQRYLTGLQVLLDMARVLNKQVYFVIEERGEWRKPPINAYAVLPNSFQPIAEPEGLTEILKEISGIAGNLQQYLRPVYTPSDDPLVTTRIRQAVKTKTLSLAALNLNSIPPEVFAIPGLRSLDLSNNQVALVSSEIGRLEMLEEINLSNNPLLGLPDEIGSLTALTSLDVGDTRLYDLPRSLQKLTGLRTLRIQNTDINVLDRAIFLSLHVQDFDAGKPSMLNFVPGNSDFMITEKDLALAFLPEKTRKENYSIIEIHSEHALPHFNTIPKALEAEVHYAFHNGIDSLPKLFSTICHELSAANNIIYICDEKNILLPGFGNTDKQQNNLFKYFKAFAAPLNILINNPLFQSDIFTELTNQGLLNMMAIRKAGTASGEQFPEQFFEQLFTIAEGLKKVAIAFDVNHNSEFINIVNGEVRKAGYEVIDTQARPGSGPSASAGPYEPVWPEDAVVVIFGEGSKNVNPSASGNLPNQELYYIQAIATGKPVLVFAERKTPEALPSLPAIIDLHKTPVHYYSNNDELVAGIIDGLWQQHRAAIKRNSLSATLQYLSSTATAADYTIYYDQQKLHDFSFPVMPSEIAEPAQSAQESGASETMTTNTVLLKNKWALVVGTGEGELSEYEIFSSSAIATTLAKQGYGLISGGWPGVDETVYKRFASALLNLAIPEKHAVLQVITEKQTPAFTAENTITVKNDAAWYDYAVGKASAIIIVGGKGGSYKTYTKAKALGIPVIPIRSTGGDALKVYRDLKKQGSYFYAPEQLDQFPENIEDPSASGAVEALLSALLLDCEKAASHEKQVDFRTRVEQLLKQQKIQVPDDLQKNRWGGKAENNGKAISAVVTEDSASDNYLITVTVSTTASGVPPAAEIAFFLHDSFEEQVQYKKFVNNTASITLTAYEAFTLGAYTEDGTMLELDLNKQSGYPAAFYYDDIDPAFIQKVEKLYKERRVTVKDDLQKNRWGGKNTANGKILIATVRTTKDEDNYMITVEVTTVLDKDILTGDVAFFMHNTFDREIWYKKAVKGVAKIAVTAYEAFTIGAYTADGTELELDLQKQKGFPLDFYYEETDKTSFYSKEEIRELVQKRTGGESREWIDPVKKSLLIFRTAKQQTWLVTTASTLFVVLDDAKTRTSKKLVQTSFPKLQALPLTTQNSERIQGKKVVRFAAQETWWYYSRELFPTSKSFADAVKDLITDQLPA